jgi:lipopolysaccharide biosynthesis glycosyltransferase
MKILLTFDTNYAPHAATVMESIIQNCPEKLDFVVIYYNLNKEIQDILTQHFSEKVNSLEFFELNEDVLKSSIDASLLVCEQWSMDTFLRLYAPNLLPNEQSIIYLDCDVIVMDNILKILEGVDLSKPVCAVTEYDSNYKSKDLSKISIGKPTMNPWFMEAYWYRLFRDLDMDLYGKYFNAGVLIMNLDYFRVNQVTEKCIHFLKENPKKVFGVDQDALNHALNGNYFPLDPRWNSYSQSIFSGYSSNILKNAKNNPAIIHVVGLYKPWKYLCETRYQKLYWSYRKFTPWSKKEYKDKTVKNRLKKYVLKPVEKLIGERNVNRIKNLGTWRKRYEVFKLTKHRVWT